jgi:nitrate/TMAO reductase-like tetraheme cytochrome c subunit
MSYKDANANQNQNCRDCFNHLDEPRYTTGKVAQKAHWSGEPPQTNPPAW